jgi:hypothetical protein
MIMLTRLAWMGFMVTALVMTGFSTAQEKDKKKRTGTVIGEIKSSKPAPNKINHLLEVLAVGEENARTYRVAYDPKVKGPMPEILAKVKAAKVGDRVRLEWVEGEGFNITAFEVLKSAKDSDKKK